MWPALEALLDEIDVATPQALRIDSAGSSTIVLVPAVAAPSASAPLRITVGYEPPSITVTIETWTERFACPTGDDPDDDGESLALDLVAAALFGRLRVRTHGATNGNVTARQFVFATAHGPVVHRSERAWRWPWQRTVVRELANATAVPPTRTLGDGGAVPWAPWAGTLAVPADAAPGAIAIDGELDLHPFSPRDVKPLLHEYIEECKQRGITHLRIVHGKGIGALRRTVHALLAKHPDVETYRIGGMGEGSWGATIVTLRNAVDRDR